MGADPSEFDGRAYITFRDEAKLKRTHPGAAHVSFREEKGRDMKHINRLIKTARAQGWKVERAGKHYKFTPPDRAQRIVYVSGTAQGPRNEQNSIADLRRSGLEV